MSRNPTALIVADVQLDFLPGGTLAVAGGDRILAPLAALMESGRFPNAVATQDWHPPHHVSFASRHTGREPYETIELYGREQVLWPDHCIAGSPGASLHPALPWHRVRAIVRKGMDDAVDSYSAFRNNYDAQGERPSTGLGGYLRDCGITDVYVCGLARDYCVRATAEDAAALGFATTVLWNLTRPVTSESDEGVRGALERAGVAIRDAAQATTRSGGVGLVLVDTMYRDDLDDMLTYNELIAWHARTAAAGTPLAAFPLSSYNAVDGAQSYTLPYEIVLVDPQREDSDPITLFNVEPATQRRQLYCGCIAADDAMRTQFGLADMADRCAVRFRGLAGKRSTTEVSLEPAVCRDERTAVAPAPPAR